jgi:hypothetical protein
VRYNGGMEQLIQQIYDPSFIIWTSIVSIVVILIPIIWSRVRNYKMQKAIFETQKDVREIKLMLSVSNQKSQNQDSGNNQPNAT